MKITKKRLSKKQILATIIIIIAVVCLSIFALDKFGIISIFPQNTAPNIGKESEKDTNQNNKETFLNTPKDDSDNSVEKSKPAPVPTDNSSIELSTNKDGGNAVIIIKLKEHGYSQGKCSLTITSNSKKNTQEAPIIYQPEYSTCAGFSVPISSVGNGQWNISISVTPLNGKPITKTIVKEF